jgi:hypothetical protein
MRTLWYIGIFLGVFGSFVSYGELDSEDPFEVVVWSPSTATFNSAKLKPYSSWSYNYAKFYAYLPTAAGLAVAATAVDLAPNQWDKLQYGFTAGIVGAGITRLMIGSLAAEFAKGVKVEGFDKYPKKVPAHFTYGAWQRAVKEANKKAEGKIPVFIMTDVHGNQTFVSPANVFKKPRSHEEVLEVIKNPSSQFAFFDFKGSDPFWSFALPITMQTNYYRLTPVAGPKGVTGDSDSEIIEKAFLESGFARAFIGDSVFLKNSTEINSVLEGIFSQGHFEKATLELKRSAADHIGKMNGSNKNNLHWVLSALTDPDPVVQRYGVTALSTLEGFFEGAALTETVDLNTAAAAITGMGPEAKKMLISTIRSAGPSDKTEPWLLLLLCDRDAEVSRSAYDALLVEESNRGEFAKKAIASYGKYLKSKIPYFISPLIFSTFSLDSSMVCL